jgi:hypothetical protein
LKKECPMMWILFHFSLLGSYPNTYIFTKAVAENLCQTKGATLPLAVFRPAIGFFTFHRLDAR